MAFPPLLIPTWLEKHLRLSGMTPDNPSSELESIKLGLSRFTSENPEISIVIPAFNEGKNIPAMLSSLSKLTLPDHYRVELLVVDDASTDETPDWLKVLGVPFVRLDKNSSVREARKRGLQVCKGEIILQADADSVYPTDWGHQYAVCLNNPEIVLVYGGHSFLPDSRASRLSLAVHEGLGNIARSIRRRHREYINVHGFNSAFRRQQGLDHGSYNHDELGSEDGEMAKRLQQIGKLCYCPDKGSRVWTSPRRLLTNGGLLAGSWRRIKKEVKRQEEYLTGKSPTP